MADDETKEEKDEIESEVETSGWETLNEDDEKYIEKLETEENAEGSEEKTEVERPQISQEAAEAAAEEESDPNPLGMRFHAFWVSFGLPLVIMWAGLDALMALLNLFQGNMGAFSNVLIRGAVIFFGIPAMKGMKKFTRVGFLKNSTLIFYSCCVKVINIVMAVLNMGAAPEYVTQVFQEQGAEFAAKGITEAMLVGDIQMQFMIQIGLSVVTGIFWLILHFYYKKRKRYFKYK